MNFDFSEDQKFLKNEARRFLEANCPTSRVRKVLDDASATWDPELWKAVAGQGWLGAAIPEEHGGLGLGRLELCVIAEELGRAVAPIPFASTVYILAEAVMMAGSEAQKAAVLPGIAAGEVIGALATSEGPGALSASGIRASVEGGKLSGTKIPVTDGGIATHALVLAREGGQPGLFLVDLSSAGVTREALSTLDPSRDAARLVFDKVPAERLGGAGEGLALVERILDRAAVLLAFEQTGGADRALEMAKEYALERFAFGRTIASYQAIKHKLADVHIAVELARPLLYAAALSLADRSPDADRDVSAAKAAAGEAALLSARASLQTHGAIGYTAEHDLSQWLLRTQALHSAWGGPAMHRRRVLEAL